MRIQHFLSILPFFAIKEQPKRIVISNDDGWAVAQIRAQYDSFRDAGHDVILSAPAINQSGKGSRSKTPIPLTTPCEYDSCPSGSPAYGFNESDPKLNYVNGYPVDAARYGIQTLAPRFWDSPPDLLVSGPNVGHNLGVQVFFSGTVGAACEAAKQGIPALAFSGKSTSQVSYSTLTTDPSSPSTLAAQSYASLTTHFINTFLSSPLSSSSFSSSPLLPPQTILNINYPPLFTRPNCSQPSDVTFVLTRAFPTFYKNDVELCANGGRLPVENEVVWDEQGCWASVSVLSAQSKLDFGREGQERVWNALQGLGWGCWKA